MATFQKTVIVGTTPVLALGDNPDRYAWRVTMKSTVLVAGNTGKVAVGRTFVPTITQGQPNSGDPMVQGSEIKEQKAFMEDNVFTGNLWVISDTAAQELSVEEVVK